jgi:hypothetical protein
MADQSRSPMLVGRSRFLGDVLAGPTLVAAATLGAGRGRGAFRAGTR